MYQYISTCSAFQSLKSQEASRDSPSSARLKMAESVSRFGWKEMENSGMLILMFMFGIITGTITIIIISSFLQLKDTSYIHNVPNMIILSDIK